MEYSEKQEKKIISTSSRNKVYSGIALALIIVNSLLYPFLFLNKHPFNENFQEFFTVECVVLSVIGMLGGSLLALLPHNGMGYRRKFLRSYLLCILSIQILFFIVFSFIAICKWGLQYPI